MLKRKIPVCRIILACLGACTVFFAAGCAGKNKAPVPSPWPAAAITADGNDADWPETPPLYHDTENRLSIRAMNNNQFLYVAASLGSRPLQAGIVRTGVSLSLIPEQDPEHPFIIRVKGERRPPKPGINREKETNKTGGPGQMPGFAMADTLTITYPHGSNPMDMSLEEAENSGIAIAVKEDAGRMVIEAAIRFDAISSLAEFAPDRRVSLLLASGRSRKNNTSGNRYSGMGGGGGGPAGGGPGGGKGMKELTSPFEARLKLVLASGPA